MMLRFNQPDKSKGRGGAGVGLGRTLLYKAPVRCRLRIFCSLLSFGIGASPGRGVGAFAVTPALVDDKYGSGVTVGVELGLGVGVASAKVIATSASSIQLVYGQQTSVGA